MRCGDRGHSRMSATRTAENESAAARDSVKKSPTRCGAFPHGAMQQTPHMPATISLQTPLNTGLSLCSAEMRR